LWVEEPRVYIVPILPVRWQRSVVVRMVVLIGKARGTGV
jgi:hypothetical protein